LVLEIDANDWAFSPTSGNTTVTVWPFSGKAYIFSSTFASGNALAERDNKYYYSVGFAETMTSGNSIITQRYCAVSSQDNVGTSICYRMHGESGVIVKVASGATTGGASAPDIKANMIQASGDAFRLNKTNINANASVAYSGFIVTEVFAGDDVVNAKVGHFVGQSGHGNQTCSGVGFSGNIVFLASIYLSGGSLNVLSGITHATLIQGVATGPDQEGCTSVASEATSTTADCWRWQRNDRCFLGIINGITAHSQAEFVGFTSDGFTINWISGARSVAPIIMYLVMKISGNVKVGDFNTVSGTGLVSMSGVGFSGKYAKFMSWNHGLNNVDTVTANNRLSVGTMRELSGTIVRQCLWVGDADGPTTMENARVHTGASVFDLLDETATGGSSTIMYQADNDATNPFFSDGFTFDVATNPFSGDFSGANVIYTVIGDVVSGEAAAPQDIQRRAFGGANSMQFPSMAMGDFGGHMAAESDNRAFFGQPRVPQPMINVSGQLLY
jgi:hypothetical protein